MSNEQITQETVPVETTTPSTVPEEAQAIANADVA